MSPQLRAVVTKPKKPLRFCVAQNHFPTLAATHASTRLYTLFTMNATIGSGDVSEMVFAFVNNRLAASAGLTPIPNEYTVQAAAFEYNGVTRAITFNGGRTTVVPPGVREWRSDALPATRFGVGSFARGTNGILRVMLSVSSNTHVLPDHGSGLSKAIFGRRYDPAKVVWTNGVDGTGTPSYTMTGGGVDGTDAINYGALPPLILGRFVSGDPATIILHGDSKCMGVGDNVGTISVFGLSRGLLSAAATFTGAIAGCNFGVSSGVASDVTNTGAGNPAHIYHFYKYAKVGLEQYGTNGGGLTDSATVRGILRAHGIRKIIRHTLTPRTSSSDSWATEANQTVSGSWGVGSAADIRTTAEKALPGTTDPDLIVHDPKSLRGVDYWKWKVTGAANYATADGLHETAVAYEFDVAGTANEVTDSVGTTTGRNLRTLFAEAA